MNPQATAAKAALRCRLRAEDKLHSTEERAAAAAQIRARLAEQPVWKQARFALLFAPMPAEPDIWPLVLEALATGKRVAMPSYNAAADHYVPREICVLERDLRTGLLGIREPDPACPLANANALDFILVPGLGFSSNGCRLGRGKGYYDRLLAEIRGVKCGVAYEWQMTDEIPMEEHDVLLDCILTPSRWKQVTITRR